MLRLIPKKIKTSFTKLIFNNVLQKNLLRSKISHPNKLITNDTLSELNHKFMIQA